MESRTVKLNELIRKVDFSRNSQTRSGAALIVVLCFLVLITVLVVGFFSSANTERSSANSYSAGEDSRQLADTALNFVISTISDATTTTSPNSIWVSQPGLIRTFTGSGKQSTIYKLYSSDQITVPEASAASFDPSTDVDENWNQSTGLFTDLNNPSVVPSRTNPSQLERVFPILDPRAAGSVEGFSYTNDVNGRSINGIVTTGTNRTLPMPVRWLYVLKDGSITAPKEQRGSVVLWSGSGTPSKENPIIGRIAYWTDDETSKININTAAGDEWSTPNTDTPGSFWGVPHVRSFFDKDILAERQPVTGEFQRYPGHPATTYLSAVFPRISRQEITALTPRVNGGGSLGGTRFSTVTISGKNERLYATVDEMLFNKNRGVNEVGNAGLSSEQLERVRFFLTAYSRAPELNLWNQPRVAIWPLTRDPQTGAQRRTAFDKLIAHCATIGDKAYYFERRRADSQTFDYEKIPRNKELYSYLNSFLEKPTPGFGRKFSDKYPDDYKQILTQIFDYIRCVNLGDESPGATRYTPGRVDTYFLKLGSGQVLPIRIGNTQGFGRFVILQEASLLFYSYPLEKQPPVTETSPDSDFRTRVVLLLEMYTPSPGSVSMRENYRIRVKDLDGAFEVRPIPTALFDPGWQKVSFPFAKDNILEVTSGAGDSLFHGRDFTGQRGTKNLFVSGAAMHSRTVRSILDGSYPFGSAPLELGKSLSTANTRDFGRTFEFRASRAITVEILPADPENDTPIQSYSLRFPDVRSTDGSKPTKWAVPAGKIGERTEDWFDQRIKEILEYKRLAPLTGDNNDLIKSLEPQYGDTRLLGAQAKVGEERFLPHFSYDRDVQDYSSKSLIEPPGLQYNPPRETVANTASDGGGLIFNVPPIKDGHEFRTTGRFEARPDYPLRLSRDQQFANDPGNWPFPIGGDFDSGRGSDMDGPQINKPDEGYGPGYSNPYFPPDGIPNDPAGETFFSPNRQMPSPVMFGSLPSGVVSNKPWTTLLFNPWPAALKKHPALNKDMLPDHAILDLFWMPTVEPYAISEPFSTAGKANLNHAIAPFSYITRTTALRATLKSVMVGAIKHSELQGYKHTNSPNIRYPIDLNETIKAINGNGALPRVYRSASEICEVSLVPEGRNASDASMEGFWKAHSITGDNLRERPYADLYSRLTTKSNTYTVHIRVQSLKKALAPGTPAADPKWAQWDESKDVVTSEYQGSVMIERYIDPNDPKLKTSVNPDKDDLSKLHRFRILSMKRFAP